MSLSLRFGEYGSYWGDTMDSSHSLTQAQMEINATYICQSLLQSGWSKNAIAAMLGNMQSESAINPGRWEGNDVGVGPGYGLVQWTPFTKYTDWAADNHFPDYSTMDANLARINYEIENGIQWISTSQYPMTFEEFKTSTGDPYDLAMAFIVNYERPADPNQPARGEQARAWYEYIGGVDPPSPGFRRRQGFNWVLFNKKRRTRRNGQRNVP